MAERAFLALVVIAGLAMAAEPEPIELLAHDAGHGSSNFFYLDEDGEPGGLEYDILATFARQQGRPLEIVWVDGFDALMPTLRDGVGDLAAGVITRTPEREEVFDFSASYFPVQVVLVEPAGRVTTEAAELASATIAITPGTNHEEILLEAAPGVELVYGETTCSLFELVEAGEADGVVTDTALAFNCLRRFEGFAITRRLSEKQDIAFVLPKGSPLKSELDEYLLRLRSSEAFVGWIEKYFGAEAVQVIRSGYNRD